uniref:DUF3575 domain-containing protein n=1 Tax=candidate division WOR-3 bacterium TaxID=2052148 RepID=A0A7C4TC78_UNCW3
MKNIILVLTLVLNLNVAGAQRYTTTWRLFFNPTGASFTLPKHLDARVQEFALVYKFIGLGTKGFRVYHNVNFTGDSVELAGFIAPVYLYIVPIGAHRKALDITPWIIYLYSGFSSWGFQEGKLLDLGFGLTHYFLSFRTGYNSIRTKSRLFFNIDNPRFNDFPINYRSFYISIDLFPGYWLSLKARSSKADSTSQ